ncbi:MAG: hypothetical protein HC840_05530 [Leptolyngbyaceae cyanobacterium RM2_2_4]|nr:hypothetical protein [Leptolyngbyaceae cyanobacterium SL_5_14]NJO49014.1 hypothetical protein [Leptolyngbyaceae cyanobacterium RM2_2_4]
MLCQMAIAEAQLLEILLISQCHPSLSGDRPGIPVPVEKLEKGVVDFLDTMGRVLKQAQAKMQRSDLRLLGEVADLAPLSQ